MTQQFTHRLMFVILLICQLSICIATETPDPNDTSKYLDAVRTFADNVLKYGRDTYGPKHTSLFVDGLNIHTHEPVKWIDPDGTKWVLSNFASQQTLMRTLDGLSEITEAPKYRKAAIDAIRYAFEHLRTPSGLFYWGQLTAYDALGDTVRGHRTSESFKLHYPHYELMWKVDPEATKKLVEALWCAHIVNWSNLDMNRIGPTTADQEEPWHHDYDEAGPTFFKGSGGGFFCTGTSLAQAAATLHKLTGEEPPVLWSKRLIRRFVDTRHPHTGINAGLYNSLTPTPSLGDDLKAHFENPRTTLFPWRPFEETRNTYWPENVAFHGWISIFLVGDMIGEEGRQFTQWALEEFTAWGKATYRKKDNSFVPILTDGTNIEGYVCKQTTNFAPKGAVAKPLPADLASFWGYAVAYRRTSDEFMWRMVRDIGLGNSLGDIGRHPEAPPELETGTTCSDVYALLAFLKLYEKTRNPSFLQIALRIGDNIVDNQFHKGFFVPSKKHIYTRFDALEPLALLHLAAALQTESKYVPQVWPSCPLFVPPYRYKQGGVDRLVIYDLTDSPELPLSLQEAAASGDVGLVRSLLDEGVGVDSWEDSFKKTALQYAAMRGHKAVVEFLIDKGANINAKEDWPGGTALHYAAENGHKEVAEFLIARGADINAARTYPAGDRPLHSAARAGHKDIFELLIERGADVNVKNSDGKTLLDIAIDKGRKDITQLLVDKGVMLSSIHAAAQMGDQRQTKAFLDQGIDVDLKDKDGRTPLLCAVRGNHKDLVKLLIAKGADVNAKEDGGYTPLYYALWDENKDLTTLLISKGAEVNVEPEKDYPLIYYAVWNEDLDTVKLLVAKGAKFDVKILEDRTAFHYAVGQGSRDIAEFLVSKGIDASTFHVAAGMGDLARVKNHIEQGADVNTQDELGWTPLYWAASLGQTEVAKLLIDKGADVRTAATDGGTALHQAAQSGSVRLVELFISKGADVNAKNQNNRTPLHRAVLGGHKDVVDILITNGADVAVKDSPGGRTPLDLAKLRKHTEIVELLRKHDAKE